MAAEKKNKGGRPAKCTPEQVAAAVDELINDYLDNGVMPTDYRLMEKLGVRSRTIRYWYDGFHDKDEDIDEEDEPTSLTYQEAMNRLIDFRRQLCVENIANGASNKVTGWIFLSKQKLWGGFQDSVQRTETKGSQSITISIAGADGKPLKNGK